MTTSNPSSTALVMAMVMPRSLKDPVGFKPSYFRYTSSFGCSASLNAGAATRGVEPSFRVMMRVVSDTGICSR